MKYYLTVGEASGDLHAAGLIRALRRLDPEAEFMAFGGDEMKAAGAILLRHYKSLAYMGFGPVLRHLPSIIKGFRLCLNTIREWQPDVVILVDYSGFNLPLGWKLKNLSEKSKETTKSKSVEFKDYCVGQVKQTSLNSPSVLYYIPPKLWAWQQWRARIMRKAVSHAFTILPFETDFFVKHGIPSTFVGNPTATEVLNFKRNYKETCADFCRRQSLAEKPIIALLSGSRKQEIKDNLPAMIEAARHLAADYQMIVAGAPGIEPEYYSKYIEGQPVSIVYDSTYQLLMHATVALVTSGTATLETAMFSVPQVVCYRTPMACFIGWFFRRFMSVDYISLVNLIANREVVRELFADTFSVEAIRQELSAILPGQLRREEMLKAYIEIQEKLGTEDAAMRAAQAVLHSC